MAVGVPINRRLAVDAVQELRRTPGIPDKVPLQLRNRETTREEVTPKGSNRNRGGSWWLQFDSAVRIIKTYKPFRIAITKTRKPFRTH